MGIPMHSLVAFNVLLDILLGCTSGGARTASKSIDSPGSPLDGSSRILHFRTLDWGMDALRDLIVELDFVHHSEGPVIATSIAYFGYVGVLTGVRKGLSMSLNFRPHHAKTTAKQRLSFRWHQPMVLLGERQSISSVLRSYLLNPLKEKNNEEPLGESTGTSNESLVDEGLQEDDILGMISHLSMSRFTAAYLILCRPDRAYIVEKDHQHASVRESDTFLVSYNHDAKDETDPQHLEEVTNSMADENDATGMVEVLCLSMKRKSRMDDLWKKHSQALKYNDKERVELDVVGFVNYSTIRNEETHYVVVMDPKESRVLWQRAFAADQDNNGGDEEERERMQRARVRKMGY